MSTESLYIAQTAPTLLSPLQEYSSLQLLGLHLDRIFPSPAVDGTGMPVLVDADGDAHVVRSAGTWLKRMSFYTFGHADLGIKLAGTGISLSTTELMVGSVVSVDGVALGLVTEYDGRNFDFTFIAATTAAASEVQRQAAQRLIRALTYTKLDENPYSAEDSIIIRILDNLDSEDAAEILIADRILGNDGDNILEVPSYCLGRGDEVVGGEGHDTLKLADGGYADLVALTRFEGIEIIRGSYDHDLIRISAEQFASVEQIDGGDEFDNYLFITGSAIDLRGKIITRFNQISIEDDGATIIVDDAAMARALDGQNVYHEKLTIAGGALRDADRYALHKNGIDVVIHDGRTTTLADIGNKTLKGTTAKDVLKGSLGNDKLYGGYGNDTLTGGFGKDAFVFNSTLGTSKTDRLVNCDTITDFSTINDLIYLENAIFKKLTKTGILSKSFFKVGTKAGDANDFILYDRTTGYLSYDADGSGTKYTPVEFAKVGKYLTLTYDDFRVI